MPGFVHIFRLGTREATYGNIVGEYQLSYSEGGKTWARTFDNEASLLEFLLSDVVVTAEAADRAMEALRREGKTTLTDIDIRESEAPAMGLEQLPSDT